MQAVRQCACVPFNRRGGVSGGQQSFIRASVVTCLWWRLCQPQRRKRMINGLPDPKEKEGQDSIFGEGKCQQDKTVCVAESRLIHLRCCVGRRGRRRRCNLSVLRCTSSRVGKTRPSVRNDSSPFCASVLLFSMLPRQWMLLSTLAAFSNVV